LAPSLDALRDRRYSLHAAGDPDTGEPSLKTHIKQLAKRLVGRPLRAAAGRLGYEIVRTSPIAKHKGFELFQYTKPDGSFDYERYRQVQSTGNKEKIGQVWVMEENIAFLSEYIAKHLGRVQFGLCHGTRQGKEQAWFKKYLNCEIVGTEISDTADQFPDTIQWDFHEVKPEWIGAVDFVYSNSFDHSYDPEKCLKAWMSCVKVGGLCILEHSDASAQATELDPFGADGVIMPYLILTWGKGEFCVRELLESPAKAEGLRYNRFLILERLSGTAL
jgi:hypothetical protein